MACLVEPDGAGMGADLRAITRLMNQKTKATKIGYAMRYDYFVERPSDKHLTANDR
jgi:hypothetical protein